MSIELGMYACLFCLMPDTLKFALDKRMKPFARCVSCGATAFFPTERSLLGPRRLWNVALTLDELYRKGAAAQGLPHPVATEPKGVKP